MSKKIKIYAGFLTNGRLVDTQPYFIRDALEVYKDKIELVYPAQCVRRVFHDCARNAVVEDFLASDCDVLWFLDSDITPCKYVLDLVAVHFDKWQIAGATYPIFMSSGGSDGPEVLITTYKKNEETGNFTMDKVPTSGTQFVDGLATGCLFIKKEVFEKLERPYFEFRYDPLTRGLVEGEDLNFIRKTNKAGFKFFTDFALIAKHEKTVDLLEVNNYAIGLAQKAIKSYDEATKEQLKDALRIAKLQGYQEAKKEMQRKQTLWTPSGNIKV